MPKKYPQEVEAAALLRLSKKLSIGTTPKTLSEESSNTLHNAIQILIRVRGFGEDEPEKTAA